MLGGYLEGEKPTHKAEILENREYFRCKFMYFEHSRTCKMHRGDKKRIRKI
jgi:hypothetical protein